MAWTARHAVLLLGVFAGCDIAPDSAARTPDTSGLLTGSAPPDAPPGTCWGKSVEPAVIETVIAPVLVNPEQVDSEGVVISPAIYRNAPSPKIVQERQETWFETPCEDVMTPEFIASVQRALAARNIYDGPITGRLDSATQSAIRTFQEPDGILSADLSLASARALGLVTVPVPAE